MLDQLHLHDISPPYKKLLKTQIQWFWYLDRLALENIVGHRTMELWKSIHCYTEANCWFMVKFGIMAYHQFVCALTLQNVVAVELDNKIIIRKIIDYR